MAERTVLIIPVFGTVVIVAGSFAFIAGQLLITLIESYIAVYGGIILLGFGGSRWTSDMASSYMKYAVAVGMKLMLCYLVIGLGFSIFTQMIPATLALKDIWSYIVTIYAEHLDGAHKGLRIDRVKLTVPTDLAMVNADLFMQRMYVL